jgi:hypothetical protein
MKALHRSCFLAAGCIAIGLAHAASPRFDGLVLSDDRDGKAKSTFAVATPKLFLRGKLVDFRAGARIRGEWIAEKTKAAPPNFRIDGAELTVGPLMNQVSFDLSRPKAGWPVGDYRVDLFVDGRKVKEVRFKVQ